MEDMMTITPLGSGQEVGRSCHLLTFRSTTVLLDCGIHPGYDGMAGLPFFAASALPTRPPSINRPTPNKMN